MKILFIASEMTPLIKTGGLGDVVGALARALAERGHAVAVVLPKYNLLHTENLPLKVSLPEVDVRLPAGVRTMRIWNAPHPAMPVPQNIRKTPQPGEARIYLVEDPGLFHRPALYAESDGEYADNPLRFGYFAMAGAWLTTGLNWRPDVIYGHDWQSALASVFLDFNSALRARPQLKNAATLLTIHNLSYQGVYPPYLAAHLGLPPRAMSIHDMEFYGFMNLLKGGLVHSDWLTTVSPRYAQEIQTPEYGAGLDGVMRTRHDRLRGILNGIDTDEWNPETDPHLPAHFSINDRRGKTACKRALQQRFGLPVRANVPVMGVISRLAEQKGFDILSVALPSILETEDVQFVLLGTGTPAYHDFFTRLREHHPDKVGLELGFNNALAHQIEAGSDLFLMPSRFEPCGLNQLYSLRYGTIPLVRETGGLADSIVHASAQAVADGTATGFVFTLYNDQVLAATIREALDCYRNHPEIWNQLVENAMSRDFSWNRSAAEYELLMRQMVIEKTGRAPEE